MQSPRKRCFSRDFCGRLWTGMQLREEWALISASLCPSLFLCSIGLNRLGTLGVFATTSGRADHQCRLPLLKPRSAHPFMGISIVVPSRNIPSIHTPLRRTVLDTS